MDEIPSDWSTSNPVEILRPLSAKRIFIDLDARIRLQLKEQQLYEYLGSELARCEGTFDVATPDAQGGLRIDLDCAGTRLSIAYLRPEEWAWLH